MDALGFAYIPTQCINKETGWHAYIKSVNSPTKSLSAYLFHTSVSAINELLKFQVTFD